MSQQGKQHYLLTPTPAPERDAHLILHLKRSESYMLAVFAPTSAVYMRVQTGNAHMTKDELVA